MPILIALGAGLFGGSYFGFKIAEDISGMTKLFAAVGAAGLFWFWWKRKK